MAGNFHAAIYPLGQPLHKIERLIINVYLLPSPIDLQIDIFLSVQKLILLPMNPSSIRISLQPSGVSYLGLEGVRWNLNVALREDHRKFSAARPDEIVIG